jgi:hypothetical protein
MTKVMKQTLVKSYYRDDVDFVICDWCGVKMPADTTRGYETRQFTLEITHGFAYPEGGEAVGWSVSDLCDPCCKNLKALLLENHIKISDIDRDW